MYWTREKASAIASTVAKIQGVVSEIFYEPLRWPPSSSLKPPLPLPSPYIAQIPQASSGADLLEWMCDS